MNEWELQHNLSVKFRNEKLKFDDSEFDLVCWELMFPSWSINNKNRKWNEVSIDFIFYSEFKNLFLCVELKNNIRSKKELLSAFCQTTHRAANFIEQYSIEKMLKARKECFENANSNRGGKSSLKKITFKTNPKIKRVLLTNTFPKNYKVLIEEWNNMDRTEILSIIKNYKENKELKRFKLINNNSFEYLIKEKLLTETMKNLN